MTTDREALRLLCKAVESMFMYHNVDPAVMRQLREFASSPPGDKPTFPMEDNPQLLGELCRPSKAVTEEELRRLMWEYLREHREPSPNDYLISVDKAAKICAAEALRVLGGK